MSSTLSPHIHVLKNMNKKFNHIFATHCKPCHIHLLVTRMSLNHNMHITNVPEKVEVPHTSTLLPKWEQKGEKPGHMRNNFSYAFTEIEESYPQLVNVVQPLVE